MERVLIVESDARLTKDITGALRGVGYEVAGIVASAEEAVEASEGANPELALIFLAPGGEANSIRAGREIRTRLEIPVVYVIGPGAGLSMEIPQETEAYGCLTRPIVPAALRLTLRTALHRHRIERELQESKDSLRLALSAMSETAFTADDTGRFTHILPNIGSVFGYNPDEVRAMENVSAFLGGFPTDSELSEGEGEGLRIERRIRDRQGEARLVQVTVKRVLAEQDAVVYTCRDITESRRSDELLRAQRDLSAALSETTSLDEAFRLCIDTALGVSGMDAVAAVLLVNEEYGLDLMAHHGLPDEFVKAISHLAPDSPQAKKIMEGRTFYSFDQATPSTRSYLVRAGFRSAATIPIFHRNKLIASFHFASRNLDSIPVHIRHSLETIASQIGSALDRIRTGQALRESESKYRQLVENMRDGVGISNTDGKILEANRAFREMLGYTTEELRGFKYQDLTVEPWLPVEAEIVENQVLTRGYSEIYEKEYMRKDGTTFPAELRAYTLTDASDRAVGLWAFVRDVTERKAAEKQIKTALREKEVLLREIHHRVKNNLAVVVGILNLQSRFTSDEYHRRVFQECENRVRSMAMAHEVLYQSDTLADVPIAEYVDRLVDSLLEWAEYLGRGISLEKDIENVTFDIATAAPIGFILTELISNCLKHAFPDGREGRIRISLKSVGKNEFEITVNDNGVGIPGHIDISNSRTVGLELVDTFVEQLGGRIRINRRRGTQVRIRFSEKRAQTGGQLS